MWAVTCVKGGRSSGSDAVDLQELPPPAASHYVEAETPWTLNQMSVNGEAFQFTRLVCKLCHCKARTRGGDRFKHDRLLWKMSQPRERKEEMTDIT